MGMCFKIIIPQTHIWDIYQFMSNVRFTSANIIYFPFIFKKFSFLLALSFLLIIIEYLFRKFYSFNISSGKEEFHMMLKDNLTIDNTNSGKSSYRLLCLFFSEIMQSMFNNFIWQWWARASSYQLERAKCVHLIPTQHWLTSHW